MFLNRGGYPINSPFERLKELLKSTIQISVIKPLTSKRFTWFFIGVAMLFFVAPAAGQEMEFGLMGGGAYYLGDLNPGTHFKGTQVAYGVLIRYNIDTRWSVKLSGTRSKVTGDAATSSFLPDRALSFESPVTDISAVAEFNFLSYFTGSKRNPISPYIYGGFSVFFLNLHREVSPYGIWALKGRT